MRDWRVVRAMMVAQGKRQVRTVPLVCEMRLDMISKMVDLPAPDGPITGVTGCSQRGHSGTNKAQKLTCEHLARLDTSRDVREDVLVVDRVADIFPF